MYRKIYYLNLQYNLQHSLRIEEERNLFLGRNIDRTNSINLHVLEIVWGQFILNTNILQPPDPVIGGGQIQSGIEKWLIKQIQEELSDEYFQDV